MLAWGTSEATATSLPSTITSNTTLTAASSPYTGSSVTIDPGATLTVDPASRSSSAAA